MALYQITKVTGNKPFTAGLVTRVNAAGVELVVEAAPILGYTRGWGMKRLRDHCHRYSLTLRKVRDDQT